MGRNARLRLDHSLPNSMAAERLNAAEVYEVRDWDKASDHARAQVWIVLSDKAGPCGAKLPPGEGGSMEKDPFDLHRFLSAQASTFETALGELRTGRKRGHWMWFIFPQL